MDWKEILELAVGSGGLLAIFFVMIQIGKVIQKISRITEDISEIKTTMKCLDLDLRDMERSIAKLETRVEERTMRVIHVEKERQTGSG